MNTSINFPNLGIHLSNVGKSISIGGFEIAYYGMIIACGMILGLCIAMWVAKKTNQNPDQYFDVALYAIPIALIGARAYYVIFSWDQYKDNLIHILYFREGGLAIFGGVIAAVITFYVYVKIKKQNFWLMADTACAGLVLGQIIGRWGNFFNQEAYGYAVDPNVVPWAMYIDGAYRHPTFLYESIWDLCTFMLLMYLNRKSSLKQGESFLAYLISYSAIRFLIETLRTDSLMLGSLRMAQVMSVVLIIIAVSLIIYRRHKNLAKERTWLNKE